MPDETDSIAASLKAGISERLHEVAGNAALLGIVASLALTVWVACIAGLVATLAPYWGVAPALFIVALLVAVIALILLVVVQRRTQAQRARASKRQDDTRRKTQAALLATLPSLLRNRSGALVVMSGLAIGAMIVAALQAEEDT